VTKSFSDPISDPKSKAKPVICINKCNYITNNGIHRVDKSNGGGNAGKKGDSPDKDNNTFSSQSNNKDNYTQYEETQTKDDPAQKDSNNKEDRDNIFSFN
jgi:hypothetical protein